MHISRFFFYQYFTPDISSTIRFLWLINISSLSCWLCQSKQEIESIQYKKCRPSTELHQSGEHHRSCALTLCISSRLAALMVTVKVLRITFTLSIWFHCGTQRLWFPYHSWRSANWSRQSNSHKLINVNGRHLAETVFSWFQPMLRYRREHSYVTTSSGREKLHAHTLSSQAMISFSY